jgi:diaminopimelate epimerase
VSTVSVTKCHGTGNDFVLLDGRRYPELPYPQVAVSLCSRHFSIGADGLLVICEPRERSADAGMRIFNADGSEAEMCGNGVRCIARYLHEENPARDSAIIETVAGLVRTQLVQWQQGHGVRVEMGVPVLDDPRGGAPTTVDVAGDRAPAYVVSMGTPHVVIFTQRDPLACDLQRVASAVAQTKELPGQTNIELVRVAGNSVFMRVLERGVGETWACGTGACAAAVAAIATGRTATPVLVASRGGSVEVAWDGPGSPVFLTGGAELVFVTEVALETPLAGRSAR